jgi:drug/metabolite transporter (DMT)-like permease
MTRPPTSDLVLLTVAVLATSASAPLVRGAHAPTLAIAFWRNALAFMVFAPIVLVRQRAALRSLSRDERRLSVIAGLFLAAHFATWIPSISYTSVASSVALVLTQPIWAALIARARGDEVPRAAWAGIALAFAGAVALSGVDLSIAPRALFGDALALAGGVFAAAYVTIGADVRRSVSTGVYVTICYGTASVGLLVLCLGGRQELGGYNGATWLSVAAIVAGPQLLGHTVVNRVLRTTSPTVVSVALLFEIIGATALAWAFFDETPPAAAWPAGALIATGIVLVVRSGREPAAPVD